MSKNNSIFVRSIFILLFCVLAAMGFITWLLYVRPSKEQAGLIFAGLCAVYLAVIIFNTYLTMWKE